MTVIEQFFAAYRAGDMSGVESLVTEDASFVAVREDSDSRMPIYGTYAGRDGMKLFLQRLSDAFDTHSFVIEDVLETMTIGFASGYFRHEVRETGKLFESLWALRAKLEDGKIVHYLFFEDTARLEAAFNISTAEPVAC